MSTLTITVPEGTPICNGKMVTFRAPCDCTGVTDIILNNVVYALVGASNNRIDNTNEFFTEGSMVSVVLDTDNNKAFIQNASVDQSGFLKTNEMRLLTSSNDLNDPTIEDGLFYYRSTSKPSNAPLDDGLLVGLSSEGVIRHVLISLSGAIVLHRYKASNGDNWSSWSSGVVDNLTSTSTNVPLSANQGKVLKSAVDSLSSSKLDASKIIYNSSTTKPAVVNGAILLMKK